MRFDMCYYCNDGENFGSVSRMSAETLQYS